MAFNGDNMTPIGGNARAGINALDRNAPMGWAYQSSVDDLAAVLATGYFDTFNSFLVAGQFIYVSLTDGKFFVTVSTVDRGLKQVTIDAATFNPETQDPTLAEILVTGNVTGGTDLIVSEGDKLSFSGNANLIDISAPAGLTTNYPIILPDAPAIDVGQIMAISDVGTGAMNFQFDLLARRVQSTGLLSGGIISIASSTTVDITAGTGVVVDYTDVDNPGFFPISWTEQLGVVVTDVANDGVTNFGFDKDANVVQISAATRTTMDLRDNAIVGAAIHQNGSILLTNDRPFNLGYGDGASALDFVRDVIGPSNIEGNTFQANGVNLNLDLAGGRIYNLGVNFRNDVQLPDELIIPSGVAISFFRVFTNVAGNALAPDGPPTPLINPSFFDDKSGTLAAVGLNNHTIQQIYIGPDGSTAVAYGQEVFNNQIDAVNALESGSVDFTELVGVTQSVLRFFLIVVNAATDLTDSAQALFFEAPSFRLFGKSSAGGISGISLPGGANTNVQFNDAGAFGGDANFTWDKTGQILGITGDLTLSGELNQISLDGDNVNNNFYIGSTIPGVGESNNIAIGGNVLENINVATANGIVAIGENAMSLYTGGASGHDTAIGFSAGRNLLTALQCTAIGREAMGGDPGTLTGFGNTAIGSRSGFVITGTSVKNTFLGRATALNLTDGDDNLFVGDDVAPTLTAGDRNIVIGTTTDTPSASLSDYLNIAGFIFGDIANKFLQIGGTNQKPAGPHTLDIVGSLKVLTDDGDENIFITALPPTLLGVENIAIGIDVLSALNDPAANENTAIGYRAANSFVTGSRNNFLGRGAGELVVEGDNNIFIGNQTAGALAAGSDDNVIIGHSAATVLAGVSEDNVIIGAFAGEAITAGSANVIIGDQAAFIMETGIDNIFLGRLSVSPSVSINNFLNIGNIIRADLANGFVQIGDTDQVPPGPETLHVVGALRVADTDAKNNLYINADLPGAGVGGDDNIAIGAGVFGAITVTGDNDNVGIGRDAGKLLATALQNVLIGPGAGQSMTTGTENTFIGFEAGKDLTFGSEIILIGRDAQASAATDDNFMNIGDVIFADLLTNQARVRIGGSNTDGFVVSAALEVDGNSGGNSKGFLLPRHSTTDEGNIITPADGLMIYNTTLNKVRARENGAWVSLT